MKKRGQTSVESIILLAVILVIISTILTFREDVMDSVNKSYYATKAKLVGERLSDAASMIYQQGSGARTVIYLTVPDQIHSVVFTGNVMETSYNMSGAIHTVYTETDFIMNGSIPSEGGSYCILLESMIGYVRVSNYNQSC